MTSDGSIETGGRDAPELMYVRCATCGTWMDVKPGEMTGVTHGICASCFDVQMKRLDKEEKFKS